MGESDLQASLSTKLFEKSVIRNLVQLLKTEDDGESLIAFSSAFHAYSSDFLNFKCLEIFVDCLIERARKNFTESMFNVSYFLCTFCGDILNDPVTLKCGHTFSKKCLMTEVKADSFDCIKCGENYTYEYLYELKINVVIAALIEKFWANNHEESDQALKSENLQDKCDLKLGISKTEVFKNIEACCSFIESPAPKDLLRKGDDLVNSGDLQDALYLYLICAAFDHKTVPAKSKAIKCLHKCLKMVYDANLPLKNFTFEQEEKEDCVYVQDWKYVQLKESTKMYDLCLLMSNFCSDIEKLTGENLVSTRITNLYLDKHDFECSLCMRVFWEPITTPCGHTFCKICLYRCFDHHTACPLCKTNLSTCLAERVQNTTEFIELATNSILPDDFAERKTLYTKEMQELYNAGKDPEHFIPIFVCTTAFPTVPCPLHIFEPRYRLMIRQCMESGSRKFGMCAYIDNNITEYGTILEIKDVQYFPDGRSVVATVGGRRFHILERGERDGYNTAAVEYLEDDALEDVTLEDLQELHDHVYKISQGWFIRLAPDTKYQILQHFGPMPRVELNYFSNPDGPSWMWWLLNILPLEPKWQLLILSLTSLARRLRYMERVILHIESTIVS